ncbi:tRNA (N6-isopentenyl adenosine(37)-C2)-methylthiotransferase MiaB [Candidatus Peregrinibacteria bacterium]|nr:tRNA (N6-isopentenyl adenosine(37)-C2)-methylthiotransferase MiaB [Candidatus Peregrinibacteria bacterium]
MKYHIQTLGCQMNFSDSERVSRILENLGYESVEESSKADLLLFNTCSIRQKAEDRVNGQVRNWAQLKKHNDQLIVGLTGCMVRTSSTQKSANKDYLLHYLQGLDFVFRIEELSRLPELLRETHADHSMNPASRLFEMDTGTLQNYFNIIPKYSSRFQAYLPIMTGCDNFCTFCIVPFSRGREKSRTIEEIMKEAQYLVDNGCVEITLIGQKVNGYGLSALDKKTDYFSRFQSRFGGHPFAALLRELSTLNGLRRIRFVSSHPDNMTDDLIETIGKLETLCPYVHLPVQSGDNEVLKRMNRRYTKERYLEIIEKFRRALPNCRFTTDIIVGFCGETKEQFMNTCRLFEEVRFDMAYISQYSPRKGTVSYRFMKDDIPRAEKAQRFNDLNGILRRVSRENNIASVGSNMEILVERCENGICAGRSETFRLVHFPGDSELIGHFVPVTITKARDFDLQGEIAFKHKGQR